MTGTISDDDDVLKTKQYQFCKPKKRDMTIKTFLTTLLFSFAGVGMSYAQGSLQRGTQITTEENMVSGKPYLLMYIGNNSCYVKAIEGNNFFKALAADLALTDEAIYYFVQDGGSWKIQSRNTGKFFPVPTKSTTFAPAEEESAGSWALNFQTSGNIGNIAPSCSGFSLNRSQIKSLGTSVLHGWTLGTEQANQLRIYEIALSTTSIVDTGQEISVSGTGEENLVTDQWYVLRNGSDFFIDDAANNYSTSTAPVGFGINNSKYLVQLIDAGNSKYYVQTGFGNYLFGSGANTTTRVSATAYTATELKTLWEFYKLVNPIRPDATEVYTLNNSGEWIFVPNGFDNQYYMYNISLQKFAYPSANGEWTSSEEAVPVLLESQGDSHYCITTKDGSKTFVIGTEEHMTIAKSRDVTATETTNLNAALGNLLCYGTSKLDDPNDIDDGWYALRVYSESNHPIYAGDFIYTLPTENWYNGRPHPMSHGGEYMKHPLKDDAAYFVRLWPVTRTENGVTKTYYHWQLPNGKYVVNHNNDYPITWIRDASDFIIDQNTDGTFYIQSSGYRAEICTDDHGDDYLGKTPSKYITSATHFDIYSVDIAEAGLTPWRVVFNEGADDVKLHCTRNDVHGPTDAYHNGYFFLPTDVTPNGATDFKIGDDVVTATIDATAKTIRVTYAPAVCILPENVTVIQGSRTTGVGNTKQAVLRVEVEPEAPCHPTSFSVSLTGAANVTKIEAWFTTADQLYAEGVTSTLLGSNTSPVEGTNTIIVDGGNTSLLKMGENNYIWITADISSDPDVESNEVDASISSISYVNALNNPNTCTGFNGNPDGAMRIFYRQNYLWVSTDQNSDVSRFYRNPAILSLGDGKVLSFCEYRYDDVSELGKDYDDSDYGHRIDVLMRKSTDNGATWSNAVTIATGTDATENSKASGFSMPAVVRTSSGKIICLAAMGTEAYDSNVGLRHIAMITSSDEGTTWTTPTDIYNSIDWGEHSPSSAYITAGKGITLSNGRVAFAMNIKASGNTRQLILYSDDEGENWTVSTELAFNDSYYNVRYGKLEVMNDNRLFISGSCSTNHYGRGYSFTTGNALGDGINTWGEPANWNGNLNSYDLNDDILYYGRATNGLASTDIFFHTVFNRTSSEGDALRLYVSFDQTKSWKEFFTILPANAAVSSMQRLSDNNLAVAFEDGSIGGGANGSYALNYVIIKKELIDEQATDVLTSTIIKEGITDSDAPYVTWPSSGWTQYFTTTDKTGFADVVVRSSYSGAFNREGSGQRYLCFKPSKAGATDEITITAPAGYVIKSYTMTGYNKGSENYTLSADGATSATLNGGSGSTATFSVNDVYTPTATFSFKSNSSTNSSYALIRDFIVVLAPGYYAVKLNQVNPGTPGDRSYATLYTDYDLQQTDLSTKAYYITEVSDGKAKLTMTGNDGRDIPKRTAVLLVNSEGNVQTAFNIISELEPVVSESDNYMKGTLEAMTLEMATHDNYYSFGRRKLKTGGEWVAGFYNNGKNSNISANRAYLVIPTSMPPSPSEVKGYDISWDESEGEISNICEISKDNHSQSSMGWYTLDGRKLTGKPTTKGIYINNGRKMVIK